MHEHQGADCTCATGTRGESRSTGGSPGPLAWLDRQALSAWIDQEEERSRLMREALTDVDAGRVIAHQAVQAWADSLSRAKRALCRDAPVPRRPWMASSGLLRPRFDADALLPIRLLQPFK